MTFNDLVKLRYSVRSYTDEPVNEEDLLYILDCARNAPSAVNFQPWHIYVASKEEDKEKLQKCYNREWFNSAPMYLICCIRHDEAWIRKNDGKKHGDIDIAIISEHICLAAAERGLGTCWVCNFDAQLCHNLFNFPHNEEAAVLIPLGHISETSEKKPKSRKEITEIVTFM